MKAENKKFIRKTLIPFILREQGRGFAMSRWLFENIFLTEVYADGVFRKTPVCNTVCCIGGTIELLTRTANKKYQTDSELAAHIGLSLDAAKGLFYHWEKLQSSSNGYAWPKKFQSRFARCKTPISKARVACDLLRLIALKGEKVLKVA